MTAQKCNIGSNRTNMKIKNLPTQQDGNMSALASGAAVGNFIGVRGTSRKFDHDNPGGSQNISTSRQQQF
jgi:hypothetical protein